MSRIIASANADELAKTGVLGCLMVDLDFASGHVYLNDGFHDCLYNGNTYSALGQFGGVDLVDEQLDAIARPIKLTLSGVDPSLVGTAENEIYQNREAIVYVALIHQTTGVLVAAPEIAWEGRMDTMDISIEQNLGRITVNCEHRLRREPRIARYTDTDQQTNYAGDRFFEFTSTIQGFKSNWGDAHVNYSGPGGRGGGGIGGGPYYGWPGGGGGRGGR